MRKLHVTLIIVIAVILSLAFEILFGNFLSARLATLPLLKGLNLFNPRAPIVVTNRETVHVSDAQDAIQTVSNTKSKLSTVVYYEGIGANSYLVASGGALNWTSDGYFVTTASAMAVANKTYAVILHNGDIFPIKSVYKDTGSNLVILSTDARGLDTIASVSGSDLRPGEKMLLLHNSISAQKTNFLESYVSSEYLDISGELFNSDKIGRFIGIQLVDGLVPGQAAVNLDGKLAGMFDGTNVLSSDAISVFANNFFRDNLQVLRPSFGFTYKQLAGNEAKALQLTMGAQVVDITKNSPADIAGLQKGDIITTVGNQKVDDSTILESILASLTPNTSVTFGVTRGGQLVTITVTPKILE